MSEATLILENMRGGCATVGNTVHTLFRFNGRRPRRTEVPNEKPAVSQQIGDADDRVPPTGC